MADTKAKTSLADSLKRLRETANKIDLGYIGDAMNPSIAALRRLSGAKMPLGDFVGLEGAEGLARNGGPGGVHYEGPDEAGWALPDEAGLGGYSMAFDNPDKAATFAGNALDASQLLPGVKWAGGALKRIIRDLPGIMKKSVMELGMRGAISSPMAPFRKELLEHPEAVAPKPTPDALREELAQLAARYDPKQRDMFESSRMPWNKRRETGASRLNTLTTVPEEQIENMYPEIYTTRPALKPEEGVIKSGWFGRNSPDYTGWLKALRYNPSMSKQEFGDLYKWGHVYPDDVPDGMEDLFKRYSVELPRNSHVKRLVYGDRGERPSEWFDLNYERPQSFAVDPNWNRFGMNNTRVFLDPSKGVNVLPVPITGQSEVLLPPKKPMSILGEGEDAKGPWLSIAPKDKRYAGGGAVRKGLGELMDDVKKLLSEGDYFRAKRMADYAPEGMKYMHPRGIMELAQSPAEIAMIKPGSMLDMTKPMVTDYGTDPMISWQDELLHSGRLAQQISDQGLLRAPIISIGEGPDSALAVTGHQGRHRDKALEMLGDVDYTPLMTVRHHPKHEVPPQLQGTARALDEENIPPFEYRERRPTGLPNDFATKHYDASVFSDPGPLKLWKDANQGLLRLRPQFGYHPPGYLSGDFGPYTFPRKDYDYAGPLFAEGGEVEMGVGGEVAKALKALVKKRSEVQIGSDVRKTSFDAASAAPYGMTREQIKAEALADKTPPVSPEEASRRNRAALLEFLRLDKAEGGSVRMHIGGEMLKALKAMAKKHGVDIKGMGVKELRAAVKEASGVERGILTTPDLRKLSFEDAVKAAQSQPHLFQGPSGQFIGAPRGTTSKQDITNLRRSMDRDLALGADARHWYDEGRAANLEMAGPDPARQQLLADEEALWSARRNPDVNLGLALKGHNAYEMGTPLDLVNTSQQAGKYNLARDTGDLATRGPKTDVYRQHLDVSAEHPSTGVHDFRDARVQGYTNPDGSLFDRGLSEQEHRYMDYEGVLSADRANRNLRGGLPDWNGERAQAAQWVVNKARQMMDKDPKLTWEQAFEESKKGYGDFMDKYTAFGTHEQIPGETSGHFPDLRELSGEKRDIFSNDPRRQWADENGRDLLYDALGAYQRPVLHSQGMWNGPHGLEMYEGRASRPMVGLRPVDEGGGMDEASRRMMESAEFTRALLDAQAAGAGHYLDVRNGLPVSSLKGVRIPMDRSLTREEGPQLRALTAKYGLPDVIDTRNGLTLANFESEVKGSDISKALRKGRLRQDVSEILGAPVEPRQAMVDGVYENVFGQGTAPGSGDLTRQMLSKLGALTSKLDRARGLRARIGEKAGADAERAARTGSPFRQDLQNLRRIIAEKGFGALPEALKGGVALPSAALGVAGLEELGDDGT